MFSLHFVIAPTEKTPLEMGVQRYKLWEGKDLILLQFFSKEKSLLDLRGRITSANVLVSTVSSPFCIIQVTKFNTAETGLCLPLSCSQ